MPLWKLETYELDLKFIWKISRASSHKKKIYVVQAFDDQCSALGEVAGITTVKNQSPELKEQFEKFRNLKLDNIKDLKHAQLAPPLRFGIESAWTHFLAKKENTRVSHFLKQKEVKRINTSFSLPILQPKEIADFFHKFELGRFSVLKIKVGHKKQAESLQELHKLYKGPIRIDANEAFESAEETLNFIKKIPIEFIQFIEQPIPRDKKKEYKKLKSLSPLPVFADESLQDQNISADFKDLFHGVNIKLMKSGGYKQALKQIDQAKKLGLKVMLGCMVETSLGIHSAFNVAEKVDYFDLDGFLFFKEDPFQLVQEDQGQLTRLESVSI